MSLEPLLTASPIIQVHAFAAIAAFALGLVQFAAPKGTVPHRTIGWIWVGLMTVIAISSFWILSRDPNGRAFQPIRPAGNFFSSYGQLSTSRKEAFSQFALHSGNHEMQRYNTGFAGYKTFNVSSNLRRLREGVEKLYEAAAENVKH